MLRSEIPESIWTLERTYDLVGDDGIVEGTVHRVLAITVCNKCACLVPVDSKRYHDELCVGAWI